MFFCGMPHGRCDSMDLISPSFVLEVCFFVVFFCGTPHGRHDSMDFWLDFSFLHTGGVLLRGVLAPWAS